LNENDAVRARVAALSEQMREFQTRADGIGIFAFGSATRPYADAQSDIDVGVVVTDASRAAIGVSDIQRARKALGDRAVDVSFWGLQELASSTLDCEVRNLVYGKLLHDPGGALARLREERITLAREVREARTRVTYFEFTYLAHRLVKTQARGTAWAVSVLGAELVTTAVKLLFVERSEWPAAFGWAAAELAYLDVPVSLTETLFAAGSMTDPATVRRFRRRLDAYLVGRDNAFVRDPIALWEWVFRSAEGVEARRRWAGDPLRFGR